MRAAHDYGDVFWADVDGHERMLVRVIGPTEELIEAELIRAGVEQNPGPVYQV